MTKKEPFFKRIKEIYRTNPVFLAAVAWVGVMPSIGSLALVQYLISSKGGTPPPDLTSLTTALLYVSGSAAAMGIALIPTTLLAVFSGFYWGWSALPLLAVAYSIASAIGYGLGKKSSGNLLPLLTDWYPAVKTTLEKKKEQIGSLIFFIRISPVIPFAFSNILFALLHTGLGRVVWYGLWGMLPRTVLAFSSGVLAESIYEAVSSEGASSWEWLFVVGLLVISILGIVHFFKNKDKESG